MMDFMVICTGTLKRHVNALGQNVFETFKKRQGLQPIRILKVVAMGSDLGIGWLHMLCSCDDWGSSSVLMTLKKLWDIKPEQM